MKKYLLLAALFYTIPAHAGEFEYDYGLTANGFYGYSDYSDNYRARYKHNHTPSTAEISTSAAYRTDDILYKIGVDAQISGGKEVEDYNHGEWGENIYGSVSSENYGELSAGQIYNAAYQLAVGAPRVGAFRVNNSMITDFIANPNWQRNSRTTSYRTVNSTYLNTDADAPKISYTTPEFYNTKAAFSYTPDSYSEAGLINKHSRYDNRSSYAAGLYNDLDIDDYNIESSLGYAFNHKNNQEVSVGLSVYHKGWTFGGSYRKSFTTSSDYDLNLQEGKNLPFYYDGYRRSQAFNLGLTYEFGPLTTGVSYFAAFADETDNKDKILTWANRIALHKHLNLYLAAAYAEYEGNDRYDDNNRGYAFISGLEIDF